MFKVSGYGYKVKDVEVNTYKEAIAEAERMVYDERLLFAEIMCNEWEYPTVVFWWGRFYVANVHPDAAKIADEFVMAVPLGGAWASVYYCGDYYLSWDYNK